MPESGIFKNALELPAHERAEFLDKACGANAALRLEVEGLLRAHEQPGDFMSRPPIADATTTLGSGPERPGMRVGPYKLLQFLGEGGMGTVFLAEQSQPIRRMVALKIIKHGMDSAQVLARFEAERQALALMDHPNIAKVLDAGKTDDDTGSERPYFVMELVKGVPITEFCDKNKLGTRDRLELFVPVCQAIQHAHMKGIIHRDIKPSNVLIALYDGKPVPKVIDFGVAKAMAEPLTQRTLFTQVGQIVGTFEYMSPEQATLNQLDIDTRSDIYSLGVLLYELLTGMTPLDKNRLRTLALDQMLRAIREEEPVRPSVRLSSEAGALTVAAGYRGTESSKLAGLLRGELDWIVMKCLEKERNRRFVTAGSLAQDIERYLRDEPVTACPPSLSYRARKAYRKNRVAVLATTAIIAALVVGIGLTSWQAVRATNAERDTAAERDAAVKLGREVEAANEKILGAQAQMRVNQYVGDMQALPRTWEAGNTFQAREILAQQDAGLRGFEWHYWNRQMHTEVAGGTLPGLDEGRFSRARTIIPSPAGFTSGNDWMFSNDGSRIACLTFSEGSTKFHERTLLVWDAANRKLLLSHPIAVEGWPAAAGSSWGDFSLSNDGKRVAVSMTCYQNGFGVPLGAGNPNRFSEKDRWVIHVIDVDKNKVIFTAGKKEDGESSSASVRLSRDGRKLLSDTGRVGVQDRRVTVWDLDSPDKEPVIIDNATRCLFSPDGARVLSWEEGLGKENGPASKAWDAATGKEVPDFPQGKVISPKGAYLARVVPEGEGDSKTRTLKLYDGTTGKEISSTPLTGALVGQDSRGDDVPQLFWILFSPDESLVAVPHRWTSGRPRMDWYIVETKTGHLRRTLEDPNPSHIVSFGRPGLNPGLRYLSDDGKQFLCVDFNAIHTLSVAPGPPVRTFRGHVGPIVAVGVSPDQRLRTVELDGTLKEWDLRSPRETALIARVENPDRSGRGRFAYPARFGYSVSAGGGYVACVDREPGDQPNIVRVWDLAGKRSASLDAGPFKSTSPATGGQLLFISANGKRVALGRSPGPENVSLPSDVTVWEWDPATGAQKQLLHREFARTDETRGVVATWEFSKDGSTVVLYRYDKAEPLPDGGDRYRVTLWTIGVDTGREGPAITIDGTLTAHGCLSPDGKRYASFVRTLAADGSWNDQFTVWDLVGGTQVFAVAPIRVIASSRFPGALSAVSGPGAALWSPDGSRVAVLGGPVNGSIALYDAATGTLVRTLNTSTRSSSAPNNPSIAFSPDGRRIACEVQQRSGGSAISVLDTESGKEVLSLTPPPGFAIPVGWEINGARLTFSPDGHRLLLFARVMGTSAEDRGRSPYNALRVHTWDATPLPQPKQP